MNIDELTIGEVKTLVAMLRGASPTVEHPAIGKYVVVRTYSAGVHTGILAAVDDRKVELRESRRIWSWQGALSCSEIAQTGITAGKVSVVSPAIFLTEAIEIIPTTKESESCLRKI